MLPVTLFEASECLRIHRPFLRQSLKLPWVSRITTTRFLSFSSIFLDPKNFLGPKILASAFPVCYGEFFVKHQRRFLLFKSCDEYSLTPALFSCLFLLMQAWNAPSAQQPVKTVSLRCFYVCSYWCKRGMHHQLNNLSKQSPCTVFMFVLTDASVVLTKRGMHHQPDNLSKQSPCAVFMFVLTKRGMHHQPNNLSKQSPCAVFMFVLTDASVVLTKRGMHHQPNNLSKRSPCAV